MEELYLPEILPPGGRAPDGVGAASGRSESTNVSQINRAGNMYQQLETMMSAVRKEAMALDDMKLRLSEMEDLKVLVPELKQQLAASDAKRAELERTIRDSDKLYMQLKADMQRLNDLYNTERKAHLETQHGSMQQEADLSRLQQENVGLHREVEKNSELRKRVHSLQQQLNQSEENGEELKKAAQRNLLALKKKYDELEMEKHTQLELLAQVSDELTASRAECKKIQDEKSAFQVHMNAMHTQQLSNIETLQKRLQEQTQREDGHIAELSTSQTEIRKLKDLLQAKSEACEGLMAKLKASEENRSQDAQQYRQKQNELNDVIGHLKSQNHMCERQSADALHKLGLVSSDISRLQNECERLRSDAESKEALATQKETLIAQQLQSLALAKEENFNKFMNAQQQVEALQQQLRDAHAKHWDELQQHKDNAHTITEETEVLQQELHEQTLKCIALEAEKHKLEEYVNTEVMNASTLSQTLRTELEKRIEELTTTRKERDALLQEVKSLQDKIADFDNVLRRNEALFKQTLDNDRSKIQQEVRTKLTRLKVLESDKSELLRENQELHTQMSSLKKEVASLTQSLGEQERKNDTLTAELEASSHSQTVMERKLHESGSKERELAAALALLEGQFRTQQEKLEQAVKDTKKEAAQQVIDLSSQLKYLTSEVESLTARAKELESSEKKAWAENNRMRTEMDALVHSHDSQQHSQAEEFATLRRENRDAKLKLSLAAETKTKADLELLNMTNELNKYEIDLAKAQELHGEQILKIQEQGELLSKQASDIQVLTDNYGRCRARNVELEETMNSKLKTIDKQAKDIAKLEREGVSEIKRLKLLLANTERELEEMKPQFASLQKELNDGRGQFAKLQSTTNSTVNELMDELRSTEDALANERKRCMHEIDGYHAKIADLQSSLDRAREQIEESNNKSKNERNEKELRVLQLEREVERLRESLASRDTRISELEKQKQSDRLKLHELRDKADAAERRVVEAQSHTEMEVSAKAALENRVRMLEEALRSSREFSKSMKQQGQQRRLKNNAKDNSRNNRENRSRRQVEEDEDDDEEHEYGDGDGNELEDSTDQLFNSLPSYAGGIAGLTSSFDNSSGAGGMSPIDRVSAALSSRAAAESSKHALKKAQSLRNTNPSTSANGATVANTVPQQQYQNQSSIATNSRNNVTNQVPAQTLNADPYYDNNDDDEDEGDGDGNDNRANNDGGGASYGGSPQQAQAHQSQSLRGQQQQSHQQLVAGQGKLQQPQSVEDSISKTQSFLQRRMAAQARLAAATQQQLQQKSEDGEQMEEQASSAVNDEQQQQSSYLQAAMSASMLAAAAFEKQMKGPFSSSSSSSSSTAAVGGSSSNKSSRAQAIKAAMLAASGIEEGEGDEEMQGGGDEDADSALMESSISVPSLHPSGPGPYGGSSNNDAEDLDDEQQYYLNMMQNYSNSSNNAATGQKKKKAGKKTGKKPSNNNGSGGGADDLFGGSVVEGVNNSMEGSFLPKIPSSKGAGVTVSTKGNRK